MNYIIDEDELKDLLNMHIPYFGTHTISELHQLLTDFLKSKKPVEEIASGEVIDDIFEYEAQFLIGDKDLWHIFQKYDGKSIKIYIEESKDEFMSEM